MRIVITGGCGFLGRRVALKLLAEGSPLGPVDELALFDNAPSALPLPEDKRLTIVTGDIADRETIARLITRDTDAVFHLAAIVSGQAEADTDLGYRVNLDGTRAVLDACRAAGNTPRIVFASSLAVYGGKLPSAVGDDTALTPQTSYGTQKAIGELLVIAIAGVLGVGRRDGGGIAPRRRRSGLCSPALAARSADPGDCLELAAIPRDTARRGARFQPRQWHRCRRRGLHGRRSAIAEA